jgi:hypothetical protein
MTFILQTVDCHGASWPEEGGWLVFSLKSLHNPLISVLLFSAPSDKIKIMWSICCAHVCKVLVPACLVWAFQHVFPMFAPPDRILYYLVFLFGCPHVKNSCSSEHWSCSPKVVGSKPPKEVIFTWGVICAWLSYVFRQHHHISFWYHHFKLDDIICCSVFSPP